MWNLKQDIVSKFLLKLKYYVLSSMQMKWLDNQLPKYIENYHNFALLWQQMCGMYLASVPITRDLNI